MWNAGIAVCLEAREPRRSKDHSEFQMKLCGSVGDAGFYRQLRTKVVTIIILIRILSLNWWPIIVLPNGQVV